MTKPHKSRTPTYTAFFQDQHDCIVYRSRENDGTLEKLPQGAVPSDDPRSTYYRTDGGDRFEFAWFVTERGQTIIIQRDGKAPIQR